VTKDSSPSRFFPCVPFLEFRSNLELSKPISVPDHRDVLVDLVSSFFKFPDEATACLLSEMKMDSLLADVMSLKQRKH
jgi:hypothetical protein